MVGRGEATTKRRPAVTETQTGNANGPENRAVMLRLAHRQCRRALSQSPNSFWRSSRRCWASSDSVAVGRASRRGTPIGSPVSSHQP